MSLITNLKKKSWFRWVAYITAIMAFTVSVMMSSVGVIIPELMRDLNIEAVSIGALTSVYAIFYAIMQIPGGLLSDRYGPRKIMSIFLLIGAVGILLFSWAPNYAVSVIARAITAIGVGVLYVGQIKVIRDWFSVEEMGTVMGVGSSINSIGALVATPLIAYSVGNIGWRWTFTIIGGATLLFSLLIWIFVRERDEEAVKENLKSGNLVESFKDSWNLLKSNPQFTYLFVIMLLAFGGVMTVYRTWGIPFLSQSYSLTKLDAAWVMTVGSVFSLVGGPLWGYFSDKVVKKRIPFVILGLLGSIIPFLVITLFGKGMTIPPIIILFSVQGFVFNGVLLGYTMINEMVPVKQSGFFSAFLNMGPYIGSSIFLIISGKLLGKPASYLTDGTPFYLFEQYRSVLVMSVIAGLLALLLTFLLKEVKTKGKIDE